MALGVWLLKPGMADMWVCCWRLRYWDGQIYFCLSWWLARVSVSMAPVPGNEARGGSGRMLVTKRWSACAGAKPRSFVCSWERERQARDGSGQASDGSAQASDGSAQASDGSAQGPCLPICTGYHSHHQPPGKA